MKGSAILYLQLTKFKNTLKESIRKPGRLILILFLLGFVIFSVAVSDRESVMAAGEYRNLSEVIALAFALYGVIAFSIIQQGLKNGATFFKMSDVNLLFTSPVKAWKVLAYGLVSQMGTALLAGFFLLYQYSWLHNSYGVTLPMLIAVLLGYALVLFLSQLAAVALYAFSGADPAKKARVRLWFYVGTALCAAVLLFLVVKDGLPSGGTAWLDGATAAVNSVPGYCIPVIGWVAWLVSLCFSLMTAGFSLSGLLPLALGLAGIGLFVGLLFRLIAKGGTDFYEDVLTATEVSFAKALAAKAGKAPAPNYGSGHKGKTGLTKGRGASVFFFKHMLEDRRQSLFFLDGMSLLFAAMAIIMCLFFRGMEGGLYFVVGMATYFQVFSSFNGRWLKELTCPYVYMAPLPPFQKLLGIMGENIVKIAMEAAVVMIPIGLLLSQSPAIIALLVLLRFAFGLLLMTANLVTERLLGDMNVKWLVVILHFLFVMVMAAPGIVAGVLVGNLVGSLALGLLIVVAWCVLAALGALFLNRNILNYVQLRD